MKYRRFVSGAVILAVLVAAATSLNFRQVEAQQAGPDVTIASPLPLPVSDAGPQIAFQASLTTGIPITLPNDRRLTIEFLSISCVGSGPATGVFVALNTVVGGSQGKQFLFPTLVFSSSGFYQYGYSGTVRIYADAGTNVVLSVGAVSECEVAISGFLSPV